MNAPAQRPAQPRFTSPAVEAQITAVCAQIRDPQLRELLRNCYPNTLDTTVFPQENADGTPDTIVITGDFPALLNSSYSGELQ